MGLIFHHWINTGEYSSHPNTFQISSSTPSLTHPLTSLSSLDTTCRLKTDEVVVGRQVKGFHKNLSESLSIIDFAFEQAPRESDFFHYVYLEIPITAKGRLTSMVMYFEVWLDAEETIRLDTFFDSPTHWTQIERILDWTPSVVPGDVIKMQIGQLSQRMTIVNADTHRLLRINSNCRTPVRVYASRDDEDTCDVHEDNFVGEFHGGTGEYNLFIGFVGQIYMFEVVDTGVILPSYVVTDKKRSNSNSSMPLHEFTVECITNSPSTVTTKHINIPTPPSLTTTQYNNEDDDI